MAFESPRERLSQPDDTLQRLMAKAQVAGRPLPLRIVIQLYDGQQYLSWRGLSWKGIVETFAEGQAFRRGLEACFTLLKRYGVAAWSTWLQEAVKASTKDAAAHTE